MTTTVSMTRVTNMTIEWPLQKAIDSQIMISGQFRYLATKRLIFYAFCSFPLFFVRTITIAVVNFWKLPSPARLGSPTRRENALK